MKPDAAIWNLRSQDAQGATVLWNALRSWVPWLVGHYDLADEIPGCWWAHPSIVEELIGLWASWAQAYQHPDAPADAALTWHKEFDAARSRIRAWDRLGCARGKHRESPALAWAYDPEAVAAHVEADLDGRDGPRPLKSA